MEIANGVVVLLGMGIVFVGLICIVFICSIMGAICKNIEPKKEKAVSAPAGGATQAAPIANKQELIAGICAVIAEELGTDISAIRIHSFKKI